MINIAKRFSPPGAIFPPYQGMQYMRDMMSGRGQLAPLDNGRYPNLSWTSIPQHLAKLQARGLTTGKPVVEAMLEVYTSCLVPPLNCA